MECLNIIRRLVIEYKEDPAAVDTVLQAIENIRSRKAIFTRAYSLNVELPMVLYNLITMSIEQSVSFLIATCIQYIKDPASQDISAALDKVAYKNTMQNLLFEQLYKFNEACVGKQLDDVLSNIIKNGGKLSECGELLDVPERTSSDREDFIPRAEEGQEVIHEPEPAEEEKPILNTEEPVSEVAPAIIGAAVAATPIVLKGIQFLIKLLIPIMRSAAYFCVNSLVKFSDCLAVQSQLIEINAYKLQYSDSTDLSDEKKAKVVKRQLKIAEKLRKWSNRFSIDHKNAQKKGSEMEANDNKKIKVGDMENLPADVAMAGDLF
jgi:hypothetical protein